ncbi:Eaa1 [Klebsiella variicola]|nr:DUF551 domain-containing protein [Klebsiella variicola]SXE63118.1 Eaa1 [Klebsiella variicola]
MTKSTITVERITSVIERLEHYACNLKWTNVRGAQDLLTAADGLRELQERRKADSEPVGYFGRFDPDDEDLIDQCSKNVKGAFPLYRHAQPVPVVSADLLHTAASAIEDLLEHTDPNTSYYSGVWADVPGKLRAAAPQSPGSEPATVPGTWIPVSERLPEAGGDMIVFTDGIVMSGVSYAKKKGFYIQALEYDDDEPVDSVTHWMPLPAGPQEPKP